MKLLVSSLVLASALAVAPATSSTAAVQSGPSSLIVSGITGDFGGYTVQGEAFGGTGSVLLTWPANQPPYKVYPCHQTWNPGPWVAIQPDTTYDNGAVKVTVSSSGGFIPAAVYITPAQVSGTPHGCNVGEQTIVWIPNAGPGWFGFDVKIEGLDGADMVRFEDQPSNWYSDATIIGDGGLVSIGSGWLSLNLACKGNVSYGSGGVLLQRLDGTSLIWVGPRSRVSWWHLP